MVSRLIASKIEPAVTSAGFVLGKGRRDAANTLYGSSIGDHANLFKREG